ncbi:MAG: pyridoxamine 5'-phosphate oxidase family protein [Halobacteriales archaeon]|nr:pyridoxamine 5'-phosphate oxidase family protein [Halobacteriales archaeon]
MAEFTGAWSAEGVAEFLGRTTVPVRLGCRTPADRPWMVSLWYRYDDGELVCATARDAAVVGYLEHDPDVSFEVSTNDPPYRGVRGNGAARIGPDEDLAVLRSLLERYLGGTDSALADQLLGDERDEVAIRIAPEKLYSWDFSERMRDVSG